MCNPGVRVFRLLTYCKLIPCLFLCLVDIEAQTKERANSPSCEGARQRIDTAAGTHKSFNTEAATKSKAKVFLLYFSIKYSYELEQNSHNSSYYYFFEYS